MIKVDLWGRFGNQLYQYAFALNTAKKIDSFFLIAPTERCDIVRYFKLDIGTQILFNRFVSFFYTRFHKKLCYKKIISEIDGDNLEPQDKVNYKGFFQSELFFKNSESLVRSRFEIKKKWQKKFNKKYRSFFRDNKIIVLHIRRTDYVEFGGDSLGGKNLCLPMSYYENCLKQIEDIEQYKIICISDDIAFVKDFFRGRPNFYFEENNMIVDFQIMLKANIVVVANSSFAWWAAYLNQVRDRKIYAPKYWLGFKINREYPTNIIPKQFIAMNVF